MVFGAEMGLFVEMGLGDLLVLLLSFFLEVGLMADVLGFSVMEDTRTGERQSPRPCALRLGNAGTRQVVCLSL